MTEKNEIAELAAYADVFGASGYFAGLNGQAQGIVLLLAGRDLGLSPFAAMQSLHVVEGKPVLSANAYAAALKRSPKYDYEVVAQTRERCELRFVEIRDGERVKLGTYSLTLKEAKDSGLAMGRSGMKRNWKVHPDAMLFARCVSQGCRIYCPDVFGFSVYTEADELADAEPIQVEQEPPRQQAVDGVDHQQDPEQASPEPDLSDAEWEPVEGGAA